MKTKILIFVDWYRPGYKAGGPIRSISNIVAHLNTEFDFFIVTRNTDYLETIPYSEVTSNKWNVVDGAKVYYIASKKQRKSTIKQLIEDVQPDLIYCNSLYSPKFTLAPLKIAKKLNIKTVLAVRGMLSPGSLSVKSHKKKIFIAFMKAMGWFDETLFHATSENEKKDIIAAFGNHSNIVVAQNLPEIIELPFQNKPKTENHLKMAFVGRIAPEKNTLYAIEVLKKCKHTIELDLYGAIYNYEYYQLCKRAIKQLPNNIAVKYKGAINHSLLNAILRSYQVLYLPSTGENFGHSILEGMANSCVPLISTKTPWQNLASQKIGFDIDLDKPEQFSMTIDQLAEMNENEFNVMAKTAYAFVQTIMNNHHLKEDYYQLFNHKNGMHNLELSK